MEFITELFSNADLVSGIAGALSVGVLWLLAKLPKSIKGLFVKTIDKVDAELDKEPKE